MIGNSFGASIVLRLAAERPDLCRSLIVHEPPLVGLLGGNADAASELEGVRSRIAEVVAVLDTGASGMPRR